jgi:CubicO group peptidase (beta-lactamase class C family)
VKNIASIFVWIASMALPSLMAQPSDAKLDTYFQRKMQKAGVVGMQVGYVREDGTTWTGSYGQSNAETGRQVDDSTLFMIASCSKPVTALAILKLYNDQKLDLDDQVNRHLPFAVSNPHAPDAGITIRMLLSHTSSLKDNWGIMDPLYTLKEGGDSPIGLYEYTKNYFGKGGTYYDAEKNFLKERPGTFWAYCNMGYALLGLVVEQVSGMPFNDYMREQIFRPLGMEDSYWFLRDIPHQNITRPHVLPDEKNDSIEVLKHYGYPDFPDGQLRTTAADYLKFIALILNEGKIGGRPFIDARIIEQFHTVQYPEVHKHQAVAWNYNEFDNFLYYLLMRRLPSHTGGDPGVATVVSYDPKQKTGAVVFMNSPPKTFRGGKILYLDLPKKLLKAAKKSTVASPSRGGMTFE